MTLSRRERSFRRAYLGQRWHPLIAHLIQPIHQGHLLTKVAYLFALAFAIMAPDRALSSGISNPIQSAGADSVATAGQTAIAEDASTIIYNAAGITLLNQREVVNAVGIIFPSTSFRKGGTTDAVGNPIAGSSATNPQSFVLPSLFATSPVSDVVHIGLGIFSPDGQA